MTRMLSFMGRRVLSTVLVLAIVSVFVFLLLRLSLGDPAAAIAGDNATSEQIEEIRSKLGLDRPLVTQFLIWSKLGLQGDLGESFYFRKGVVELIRQHIEPSMALALGAIALTVLIAIPLGVIAAHRNGSWIDRVVMGFSVMGVSVPTFVIGYLLIYVFAIKLNWLPVQGYHRIADGFGRFLVSIMLPCLTLAVVQIALVARVTRASVIDVLKEDYIRTARAKGLTDRAILIRHALRIAAVPIVTVIGISMALLIGGVVVTETVFNIPGLGRLTVDAVLARDFPVIQAIILFLSFVYVIINLMIDLTYGFFDPRVRS